MDYLEFDEPEIYDALVAPEDEDGTTVVGSEGHAIGKDYFIRAMGQRHGCRGVRGPPPRSQPQCLGDEQGSEE